MKDVLEAVQEAELYRAKWTAEKRKQYFKEHPENFAGPDDTYPIEDGEDVKDAWRLSGHADDPEAVQSKIKSIAKRLGLEGSLPDTAKEEDKSDDNAERGDNSEYHALYMPVSYMSRRDDDEWIVEGQATAEVPDTFGTIFTYEASKKAFQEWHSKYANVREMHGKKAAGKGISVTYDDQNKRILVRTRVSKAEPGVWTKFHEGVLNGFSVGADRKYKMGRMTYQGKNYPAITEYNLAELSYVDAPSCPGSDAYIVARADGNLSEIIDDSEPTIEEQPQESLQEVETAEEERAGARLSADSRAGLHSMRDQAMQLCGCDECQGMMAGEPDEDDVATERMQSIVQSALERSLSPVYQRQQTFLARLAQFDTHYAAIEQQLAEIQAVKEQLAQLDEIKAVLERMASASTLDEVRADMERVKDRVKSIEDQPAPGGPVLNGARPYDKSSPYQPQAPTTLDRAQIERETLQRLNAQGAFQTQEDQLAAAALLLRPMQGMR